MHLYVNKHDDFDGRIKKLKFCQINGQSDQHGPKYQFFRIGDFITRNPSYGDQYSDIVWSHTIIFLLYFQMRKFDVVMVWSVHHDS